MTNAIFAEVVRGVEDGAGELNLNMLLCSAERLQPGTAFLRRLARECRVDGFLVQRRDEAQLKQFDAIVERKIPVALLNS